MYPSILTDFAPGVIYKTCHLYVLSVVYPPNCVAFPLLVRRDNKCANLSIRSSEVAGFQASVAASGPTRAESRGDQAHVPRNRVQTTRRDPTCTPAHARSPPAFHDHSVKEYSENILSQVDVPQLESLSMVYEYEPHVFDIP
jgi:hypothetical protein